MALAASNPNWTVAVDFNPAHIAGAREWPPRRLTNITFIEADLSRWEENPLLRVAGDDPVTTWTLDLILASGPERDRPPSGSESPRRRPGMCKL